MEVGVVLLGVILFGVLCGVLAAEGVAEWEEVGGGVGLGCCCCCGGGLDDIMEVTEKSDDIPPREDALLWRRKRK